jgi:cell division protein FtsN
LNSYTATRLQIEILARTKVQSEKAALEQRVLELQTQIKQRAQPNRASEEPMSHHGSTSFQHKVFNIFIHAALS